MGVYKKYFFAQSEFCPQRMSVKNFSQTTIINYSQTSQKMIFFWQGVIVNVRAG